MWERPYATNITKIYRGCAVWGLGVSISGARHCFFAVLYKHCFAAVLEQDIVFRIAFCKFLFDFFVQVVRFVLALPITPILPQTVFERAVGSYGFTIPRFDTVPALPVCGVYRQIRYDRMKTALRRNDMGSVHKLPDFVFGLACET